MKPRPRRAEREIAKILSRFFVSIELQPVERIPVLGRTGPDISINEFGLVVDVKSRLECPKGYIGIDPKWIAILSDSTVAARLDQIRLLADTANLAKAPPISASVTVKKWLDHMDEWRKVEYPEGISAIILHRPKLPFGESVVVVYQEDLRRFHDRYYRSLHRFYQSRAESAAATA